MKRLAVSDKSRIVCPCCGGNTNQEIHPNTVARNLPVWCRRCKSQFTVNIQSGSVVAVHEQIKA